MKSRMTYPAKVFIYFFFRELRRFRALSAADFDEGLCNCLADVVKIMFTRGSEVKAFPSVGNTINIRANLVKEDDVQVRDF